MTIIIAENQATSLGNYLRYVSEESGLPHSFIEAKLPRIEAAYRMGEPISMLVAELRMVHALNAMFRAPKTPRSLAVRVVKFN